MPIYTQQKENKMRGYLNEETKEVTPINQIKAEELGLPDYDVEQAYDNKLYLKGYAPEPPPPTEEEQRQKRAYAYQQEVDPITCHIQRLEDEEQTPEIEQEIADLKQKRSAKVEEIKERYPYPVGE